MTLRDESMRVTRFGICLRKDYLETLLKIAEENNTSRIHLIQEILEKYLQYHDEKSKAGKQKNVSELRTKKNEKN